MVVELNQDEELLQFDIDTNEEEETLQLPASKRIIVTQPADPQIDSLYKKWKRRLLDLQPSFQRRFVWDRTRASSLIESVLLSVPLPIIYLAEEGDGRESVIDGQQRLTSLFSFIDGKLPPTDRHPDGETFALSNLPVLHELKGKKFVDLHETLQQKIIDYPLRTVTIKSESDPDLKFEIFERLNKGAVALNDMELRNCIYHGKYMALLKSLAAEPEFMELIGLKSFDPRMRDVELVLRFAAFYHATYLKYQSPMKIFFNHDMEHYRNISQANADDLTKRFKNAFQIIKSLFGDKAFKRLYRGTPNNPTGYWETKRFNASLFDVLMGVFCTQDKNQVYAALDALREGILDLMTTNDEFIDAILIGTSQPAKVTKRFDLLRTTVYDILKNYKKQDRCFSYALKQELYTYNPTCAICGNHIQSIDDAAVDHIKQYWKGGQTIPQNARLTHRYCNWSRSRND